METTVRETIKNIVRNHLTEGKGEVFGQCLSAVGWVGGTLPELYEKDGMIELSMADVAAGGIVTGSALAGKRPIYIIRYQGFNWFNAPIIINYACKSKELWKIPCPIFIRAIAMEGGIGPVAGSSHHSLYFRMPGVKIASPMTSKEYQDVYEEFMEGDDVVYVSEHRGSYDNKEEFHDYLEGDVDLVLFPISITRFEAQKARDMLKSKDINIGLANILWLKPFEIKPSWQSSLETSKFGGLVLDDDYVDGVGSSIAHKLMLASNKPVRVLGLEEKTAGFHETVDNLPPSAEKIVEEVLRIIKI